MDICKVMISATVLLLVSCGGGGGQGSLSSIGTSPEKSSSSFSSANSSESFEVSSQIFGASSVADASVSSGAFSSVDQSAESTSSRSSFESQSASSTSVATPDSIKFRAWVGADNTKIEIDSSAIGMMFLSSQDESCALNGFQQCTQENSQLIGGKEIIDSTLHLGASAYVALKNNADLAMSFLSSVGPIKRDGAEVFAFNNKVWLVGGNEGVVNKNDIWSSEDGIHWQLELNHASFSPRKNHRIILFKGQLWLIGGLSDSGRTNDIWSSNDGITWTLRVANASFEARYNHKLLLFKNKLFLIGGYSAQTLADIWSSSDGVNWVKEMDQANFGIRSNMSIVEFGNKLVLTGGYSQGLKNDVWTSEDGINWVLVEANAAFSRRDSHSMYSYGNRLWLYGGYTDDGATDDVWQSTDGVSWVKQSTKLVRPQTDQKIVEIDNKLLMLGGFLIEGTVQSTDALNWSDLQLSSNVPDACRYFELKGQVYATDGSTTLWHADSFESWSKQSINGPLPTQRLCNLVVHEDNLFVIGGFSGPLQYSNDVWSSSDGVNWVQITSEADFSPRALQSIVSYGGRMWMVGGNNFDESFNEVWSSLDGIEWQLESHLDLPSSGLIYKQLIEYKGRLWLFVNAGTIWSKDRSVYAYSTADGKSWQQESVAGLTISDDFKLVVKDSNIWLMNTGAEDRSLWVSDDGNVWTERLTEAPFIAFDSFKWDNNLIWMGRAASQDGKSIQDSKLAWQLDQDSIWRLALSGVFIFNPGEQ